MKVILADKTAVKVFAKDLVMGDFFTINGCINNYVYMMTEQTGFNHDSRRVMDMTSPMIMKNIRGGTPVNVLDMALIEESELKRITTLAEEAK